MQLVHHISRPEDRVRVASLMRASRLLDVTIDSSYAPSYVRAAEPTLSDDLDGFTRYESTADELFAALMGRRGRNLTPGGPLQHHSQADRRRLLTELLDGVQSQIDEILDLDDDVLEAYQQGEWNTLRCLDRGYRLIELLKTRRSVKDELVTVYDDIDGFAPLDDEVREQQLRTQMHDEEFRAVVEGDQASQDDFDRWEAEDEFVRREAKLAKQELLAELQLRGVDPRHPLVQKWMQKRAEAKATRYSNGEGPSRTIATCRSCLFILRKGYRTGFDYKGLGEPGWKPEEAKAPAKFTAEEMAALRARR